MQSTGDFWCDLIIVFFLAWLIVLPLILVSAGIEFPQWWRKRRLSRLTGRWR